MQSRNTLSDSELIERFLAEGAECWFAALIERYVPRLLRYLRSFSVEEKELDDMVQEIALAVFRALPRFRGDAAPSTFIYAIAHRQLMKHRRRLGRERHNLPRTGNDDMRLAIQEAPGTDMATDIINEEAATRVRMALERLPGRQREVLILRYMEQCKIRDIATMLDRSEGTVKATIFKALKNLKTALAEEPV